MPHYLLTETRKDVLIRFVMLFVCLSAMFMTGSRGGVLVSLMVLILTFMIYFGRDLSRKGIVFGLLGCVATSLLLLMLWGATLAAALICRVSAMRAGYRPIAQR